MTMPARKWAAYALVFVALLLFFDTDTFLRTNWSPLHVPLDVPSELALAYALAVSGAITLLAPTLIRIAGGFAPGDSVKAPSLDQESAESRLRRRLPLRPRLSALDRGVVGSMAVLLLLVPTFLIVDWHTTPKGIYVQLSTTGLAMQDTDGPIIVSVRWHSGSDQFFLNGKATRRDELATALKAQLARRPNWVVVVEADADVDFAAPVYVMDVINSLRAKTVMLTPRLKEQYTH
jgi:biopolymer transport protein ExbD